MEVYNAAQLAGKITVVTGHFGCGKTNVSVNLARSLSRFSDTYLIDFDNVNPYYRAADSEKALTSLGVRVIVPEFANTNVDIPSVSPLVFTALSAVESGASVIMDVGGDMLGAISVGSVRERIAALPYEAVYVFSAYRPLTDTCEKAFAVLREIEGASGLKISGVINNSNIGGLTTPEDVEASEEYARGLCRLSGLPLLFTSYMTESAPSVSGPVLKLINATKKLF